MVVQAADGTGHHGTHMRVGEPANAEVLAEALVSCLHGAARTHGPALAAAVERWLVVPPELEIVKGGEDP